MLVSNPELGRKFAWRFVAVRTAATLENPPKASWSCAVGMARPWATCSIPTTTRCVSADCSHSELVLTFCSLMLTLSLHCLDFSSQWIRTTLAYIHLRQGVFLCYSSSSQSCIAGDTAARGVNKMNPLQIMSTLTVAGSQVKLQNKINHSKREFWASVPCIIWNYYCFVQHIKTKHQQVCLRSLLTLEKKNNLYMSLNIRLDIQIYYCWNGCEPTMIETSSFNLKLFLRSQCRWIAQFHTSCFKVHLGCVYSSKLNILVN